MREYADVIIQRSRRRSFSLSWKEEGFLLKAPLLASGRQIRDFLKKNEAWMERRRAEEERISAYRREMGLLTEDELKELKQRAQKLFRERVDHYAPLVGVSCGRISIRAQKTRWGSCSARGNLNFNCLLLLAPLPTLDSVVVHELCHLKEMNHSSRFYAEVLRVMPEYRKYQKWLKTEGRKLLARLP